VLPARLDDYETERDPHWFGIGSAMGRKRLGNVSLQRPRDAGAQGDQWRGILLDQLRKRGTNFFGV
jgi:hypothetical protein